MHINTEVKWLLLHQGAGIQQVTKSFIHTDETHGMASHSIYVPLVPLTSYISFHIYTLTLTLRILNNITINNWENTYVKLRAIEEKWAASTFLVLLTPLVTLGYLVSCLMLLFFIFEINLMLEYCFIMNLFFFLEFLYNLYREHIV